jgi:hypothetical protein
LVYTKKEYQKYYQNNKDKIKERNRIWRLNNPEKLKKSKINYRLTHKIKIQINAKKYYGRYKDKMCKWNKTQYNLLRDELYRILGDKCIRCGFNNKHCLQIDHVKGGGNKHREKLNNRGIGYLRRIIKEIKTGSKDYQILCANCNWIKRIENKESRVRD